MNKEVNEPSSFGRGFADAIFGRLTTNGKPAISTDQLVVTAGTAIGSFFLGKNPIARAITRARMASTPVSGNSTQEEIDA